MAVRALIVSTVRENIQNDKCLRRRRRRRRRVGCCSRIANLKDESVFRVEKTPVYTLLETPGSPDLKSRLFLTDDPALVILYRQLRQMTLQTLRGASKVTPKVEWEFVLHNARLYDRMGCDLLGLDLGMLVFPFPLVQLEK
jgi:hypothetical protein